jgi:arylsulfatase A-like enzyme
MDWSVGRVLGAIKERGLAEKTLVIFTSDNGGTPRSVNAPVRGFKTSTFEGGMRVPTIAWWPGQIPSGTETDAVVGMFDILPTFAALSSAKLPARKLDGANIWPQLVEGNKAKPAHETFYYIKGLELECVRHGDWKLRVLAANRNAQAKGSQPFKPQLYNLKTDIGEKTDLTAYHPEVVKELQVLIAAMDADLGRAGQGPGTREVGRVNSPSPLIEFDGSIAPELDATNTKSQ